MQENFLGALEVVQVGLVLSCRNLQAQESIEQGFSFDTAPRTACKSCLMEINHASSPSKK